MSQTYQGTVVKVMGEKGYGFIKSTIQTADIFFHAKNMRNRVEYNSLQPGDAVSFELDRTGDRPKAVDVVKLPTS